MVAGILENYANRGVFKGFSRGPVRKGRASFRILWHRDQFFELILDLERNTMRFPVVLPSVPAGSSMYRDFQQFITSRQSDQLPEHRRIDINKARVRCGNRGGNVSLTLTAVEGDYDYGARKLIHLVHEVYLDFLNEGHYDYLVETFDLDPDHM